MPISGLMLTLSEDPAARRKVATELELGASIEVGVWEGRRLAVVLETSTEEQNKAVWRWLNELPGISHIDVVFVSFDEDDEMANFPYASSRKDVPLCP